MGNSTHNGAPEWKWDVTSDGLSINRGLPVVAEQYISRSFLNYLLEMEGKKKRLPSGVQGFNLYANDHVLYVIDSDRQDYMKVVVDFLVAGVENPVYEEVCTLETGYGWTGKELHTLLRTRTPHQYDGKLDVIPWEIGYEPYGFDVKQEGRKLEKEPFVRNTMQNIFFDEMYKARQNFTPTPNKCVRIVSEDSGYFLKSLTNPRDYLVYEGLLAHDLMHAFQTNIIQLCVYKIQDIIAVQKEIAGSERMTSDESLLRLLATHDRYIAMTSDGNVLVDRHALKYIMRKIATRNIPFRLYPTYLKFKLLSSFA